MPKVKLARGFGIYGYKPGWDPQVWESYSDPSLYYTSNPYESLNVLSLLTQTAPQKLQALQHLGLGSTLSRKMPFAPSPRYPPINQLPPSVLLPVSLTSHTLIWQRSGLQTQPPKPKGFEYMDLQTQNLSLQKPNRRLRFWRESCAVAWDWHPIRRHFPRPPEEGRLGGSRVHGSSDGAQ